MSTRMKKAWQDVIIPNTEMDVKDVVDAFKPLDVRIEIEGPYTDPSWDADQKFTEQVYVFVGDMTVAELFGSPRVARIITSADEMGIATYNETGEKVLTLWWD
jgi:hypothetical protein